MIASTRRSPTTTAGRGTDDPSQCCVRAYPGMHRESAHRAGWVGPVSRLTALVPAEACAAAVARDLPEDLDGQVRCIDEGTRSLGLAYCCAPWSPEAEDAALRAELGDHTDAGPGSPKPPSARAGAGHDRNLEGFASYRSRTRTDFDGDAVAAGLARVPGAPPVVGLVSGPLTWGNRVRSGVLLEDAVDAASDLAAARVRALSGCGVERVIVVESADVGDRVDAELALEAHRPILRAADHLRVEVLLVSTHAVTRAAARLAHERCAGPDGCSDGLAFLPAAAFSSTAAVARFVDQQQSRLAAADTVLTSPLGAGTDPEVVRYAAGLLAALGRESPA